MQLNQSIQKIYTHERSVAKHINPEQQLRRSVMSCLLWENEFYEDGVSISERIASLIPIIKSEKVYSIALEARNKMKLRHMPLFIVSEMTKYDSHREKISDLLYEIIQRPDELTEFLAIYWKDGKHPISNQVKKGLAKAFTKFDEYQIAKYNRKKEIKLRDVIRLVHPKPLDDKQSDLFKRLIDDELATPDTWESKLSKENKRETWERLLEENKLGSLALLRNLRNMQKEGVDDDLISLGLRRMNTSKVLPFRFISAAKHAPSLEPELEDYLFKCLANKKKLKGKTSLLVDVSGSMAWTISSNSQLNRLDAACGLAMLLRELCEKVDIFTFSNRIVLIPPRRGFALKDAICSSQHHLGTALGDAIKVLLANSDHDRLIVITDEQSSDRIPDPDVTSYMINVSSYQNGIGYNKYIHIDGWSEHVLEYIKEYEVNSVE